MPMRPSSLFLAGLLAAVAAGGLWSSPARAQEPAAGAHTLHAAVLERESFVAVGSGSEAPAGLFRHRADTSWTHLGWANTRNFGLDANPAAPSTLYLACGNGVLRSGDDGETWRVVTDWRMTEILDVAVDPNAPAHVYAATAYGVWRSTDRGETWTERNRGIPAPEATFTPALAADRRAAGRLLVGSEQGVYRTEDGGATWTPVGPRDLAVRALTQSQADPRLWLAGTEEQGVWLSRDGGRTWAAAGEGVPATIYAVAVDPTAPRRMAAAGYEGGVYLSRDGGRTWTPAGLDDSAPIHALAFDPDASGRLWAGTLGEGVFRRSADAGTWAYAGLRGAKVWNVSFFADPTDS
jgi:photosystem II stability/assembly factor-like uncharacterized protein